MGLYMSFTFPAAHNMMIFAKWILIIVIFAILLTQFFIDIEHHLLPDKLNFALLMFVLIYAFLFLNWKQSLWGAGIGYLFPYLIAEAFYRLRGIEGLGGGDIKLWGILGGVLGPLGIIQNIFYSSLLGSLIGGALIIISRKDRHHAFAFGPFIIISYLLQFHFYKYIPSFLKLF
jgi:leader peptidase (prepilin peptidase)/N-methyltransferase